MHSLTVTTYPNLGYENQFKTETLKFVCIAIVLIFVWRSLLFAGYDLLMKRELNYQREIMQQSNDL